MPPSIHRGLRLRNCAVILAGLFAFLVPEQAAAETCRCLAHFEVRTGTSPRQAQFKPDIPVNHFTALSDKGALETSNACRRDARDQAHACMDNIWRNRLTPTNHPSQCHTSRGIQGSVPYDIKAGIERAACQTGSPVANRHNAVVKVYRRTHGGAGCGPNLESAQSVFVSDYEVDCLSIRSRQKLGMVAETAIRGIDRPGADLPRTGTTVGNGTVDACKGECLRRNDCRAWTWVPAGVQGKEPKCWLKGSVPWHKASSVGMISGTRQHNSR